MEPMMLLQCSNQATQVQQYGCAGAALRELEMSGSPWAWAFFLVYVVVTATLAWRGGQKGAGAASFALGSGRMNPLVAGVTLGACLASSAMFVIFPGFVYAEGLPALIGFGLPLIAGLGVGLALFAPRFQALGSRFKALTVPHWLGARYESPALRRLFSGLNVLNVAYLVLIAVGCGYVMERALGVPYPAAVIGIVVFVFGYTGFGGAWAHAFTNSLQGGIMLVVALLIAASGVHTLMDGSLVADLQSTGLTAPGSVLFSSPAEVWLVPFVMGVALTTQPHLLTKALYVEGRRDLMITILTGMGTFAVFSLVLLGGAYARLALPAGVPQDQAMAEYLLVAFPWEPLVALVSVAILSASMSTMDGLLVAVSASVANDLFPGKGSVTLNRVVLGVLAAVTIAIALFPPTLVLILGQQGVYGLVAASAGPLVVGLFWRGRLSARWAAASALMALGVHFGVGAVGGLTPNPGVAACVAILVGLPVSAIGALLGAARPVEAGDPSRAGG
jgi:sodium/pantothenate symporter